MPTTSTKYVKTVETVINALFVHSPTVETVDY